MPTKRHSAEQIVRKLREAEVELAQGATVKDACRKLAITEHTYYRWRREYGGLKLNQARKSLQQRRAPPLDRLRTAHATLRRDHSPCGTEPAGLSSCGTMRAIARKLCCNPNLLTQTSNGLSARPFVTHSKQNRQAWSSQRNKQHRYRLPNPGSHRPSATRSGRAPPKVSFTLEPRNGHRTDPDPDIKPGSVPRIARLMGLAIRFDGRIRRGQVRDYAHVARLGYVTRARATQIMNLLYLERPTFRRRCCLGRPPQQRLTTLYLLTQNEIPPYYTEAEIMNDPRHLYVHLETGDFQYYLRSVMGKDPTWVPVTDCFAKKIKVFEIARAVADGDEATLEASERYNEVLNRLTAINERAGHAASRTPPARRHPAACATPTDATNTAPRAVAVLRSRQASSTHPPHAPRQACTGP